MIPKRNSRSFLLLMTEQGGLHNFLFHLVLLWPLWIVGKKETGIGKRKWEWSSWARSVGLDKETKAKEAEAWPGSCACAGGGGWDACKCYLARALGCCGMAWRGILVRRVKGLFPVRHMLTAHILSESQNHLDIHAAPLELLGCPALSGWAGNKKYNWWILFHTGLTFLFIKVLETAVAYAVYLALKYLICKSVKWGRLFF